MAVADTPEQFRKSAADARREAEKAKTPEAKLEFLKLAEQWERLAKSAEKSKY